MLLRNTNLEEWLNSHGVTLEPDFVTTLKTYSKAYKKRQATA